MKKISVILTTYNSSNFVQKTIDSIVNQEGKGELFELELIVVDDCSSDNTTEILKQYQAIIQSTEKNSGGPNTGRNIGLKLATGDYICIADHDDEWKENKIIQLLPYLDKAPIISSGFTVIDKSTGKRTDRVAKDDSPFIEFDSNRTFISKLTKSLIGQNTYLGSIVYHASLKNILFEEHFGVVDFDWVVRLFHKNKSIEITESLYYRYVDGENLSLNESYRRKDFYYSLMFIEQYEKEYPKEVAKAYKKIHGTRARYYYMIDDMKKARKYFLKSEMNWKTWAYYFTSFFGSKYVKKKFEVFG